MRKFFLGFVAHINPVRWALFVMAVCFVAVVGVYDYIDLSTSVAITFSSFETVYVLLTNPANLAYIFLPLYLFIICGLTNASPFGVLEMVRYRSRYHWWGHKWLLLMVYTLVFFGMLFGLVAMIANQAFPYQTMWSTDFVNLQVSLGQAVANFVQPPLYTIGMSLMGACLLYYFAGCVTMVCGLMTQSEPLSLLISMVVGLTVGGLANYVWFVQKSVETQALQGAMFALASLVLMGVSYLVVAGRDFAKKG